MAPFLPREAIGVGLPFVGPRRVCRIASRPPILLEVGFKPLGVELDHRPAFMLHQIDRPAFGPHGVEDFSMDVVPTKIVAARFGFRFGRGRFDIQSAGGGV